MAICIYVGCIKATTNNWDIRPSVTTKALLADISWTAGWIHIIELALESAHQTIVSRSRKVDLVSLHFLSHFYFSFQFIFHLSIFRT